MLVFATLISFGALLIPAYYFLCLAKSAPTTRRMYIGIGLQVLWTVLVAGLVYLAWHTGRTDYYRGWAMLIPVNVISALFFLIALVAHHRDAGKRK